jgi:hypothetical protein
MDVLNYTKSFKKQTCLYQPNLPVDEDSGLLEYVWHRVTHYQQFEKILCLPSSGSQGPKRMPNIGGIKRYIGTVLGAGWKGVSQSENSGRGLGVHLEP